MISHLRLHDQLSSYIINPTIIHQIFKRDKTLRNQNRQIGKSSYPQRKIFLNHFINGNTTSGSASVDHIGHLGYRLKAMNDHLGNPSIGRLI